MKKLILFSILSGLSLAAMAQAESTPPIVQVPAPGALAIDAGPLHNMWPDTYGGLAGGYDLANGRTLAVTNWGLQMFARIDAGPAVEIGVVGPNTFVAYDRSFEFTLIPQDNGDVRGELLEKVPNGGSSPPVAGNGAGGAVVRLALVAHH